MKKGFSLIELLVSLVIISIVVVFISSFVLNIRDEKDNIAIDVPSYINKAAISRVLNYDSIKNGGIVDLSVTSDYKTCTITYNNRKTGVVEINSAGDTLTYTLDGVVELIRTLTGTKRFNGIVASSDATTYSPKVLLKYVISMSDGNNIEVVSYAVNSYNPVACRTSLYRNGTDSATGLPVVRICNEEFYDITNKINYSSLVSENGNIYNYASGKSFLLAKYDLYVGKVYNWGGDPSYFTISSSDIGYNLQSEFAKGYTSEAGTRCTVSFSGLNYWVQGGKINPKYGMSYLTSNIYDVDYGLSSYVERYVNILKSDYGLPSSALGRLLTYTEANSLTVTQRNNGSRYWLATPYSDTVVLNVYEDGSLQANGGYYASVDGNMAVRPLLVVNTSDIQSN